MKLFVIAAIAGLALCGALIYAAYGWMAGGDTSMGGHGWAALIIGVVMSVAVGAGLMALVFYSARHGYDEAAHVEDDDLKP